MSSRPLRGRRSATLRGLVLAACLAGVVGFGESCYTLNGISISPATETFYVAQFDKVTSEGPPDLAQRFSELLKRRVNDDTRLAFAETDPDVEFVGSITGFTITPEAPNPETGADLNRLTIRVQVDYTDAKTPDNSYSQTFTDFENFAGAADPLTVQDDLVEILFDRLTEEAFNKAFSNW